MKEMNRYLDSNGVAVVVRVAEKPRVSHTRRRGKDVLA